ncbi:fibronectin type III domain-containing protein [Longispora urticae]
MRTRVLTAMIGAVALTLGAVTASHVAAATPAPPPDSPPTGMIDALSRDLGISRDAAVNRLLAQGAAETVARTLSARVREQSPGHWLDERTGRLMVAVVDEQAAAQVGATGATPVRVLRDRAELGRLSAEVARLASRGALTVTGWGVDPVTDTVVVRVLASAGDTASDAATGELRRLGDGVRILPVKERPGPQSGDVRPGGRWLPGAEANCSVGFPATDSGGGRHFLTAGHCTNDANQPAWGADNQQDRIGTSNVGGTRSVFGREGDMGVVAVTEAAWRLSASVNTYGGPAVTVTGATEPMVNQAVCHAGLASGWQCGKVTAVNQTVVYTTATLEGIAHTTACSLAGDSGGAWLAGTRAVGLHSGGYASCSPGGADDQSLFQPVGEALSKWGLTLHTGGMPGDTQAPTVPTSVRSSNVTATSVSLEWNASTDNVGVTGYQVFNGTTLAATVTNTTATISGLNPSTSYTFSVKATDAAGNVSASSGPLTVTTKAGGSETTVYSSDFESGGWTVNPNRTDTATSGRFEVATPQATSYNSLTMQRGNTTSGTRALVTGAAAGASVGDNDLDGGVTSALSGQIALPADGKLTLTLSWYLGHLANSAGADYLRVSAITSDGATVLFEKKTGSNDTGAQWTTATVDLTSLAGRTIRISVEAADAAGGSLVEAGIDDVRVTRRTP